MAAMLHMGKPPIPLHLDYAFVYFSPKRTHKTVNQLQEDHHGQGGSPEQKRQNLERNPRKKTAEEKA
jgi:hypothetical protein